MAKVKINGKDFEVPTGQNLVDAAENLGIDIPHYCYHPGLSIAGQCRMCYVEQPGNSKLQIACNMKCSDGLEVITDSPKVKDAVKWSLEFHLINHPIDCPICDQAGECGLQDYYMEVGKYSSEMREHKQIKQKAVDLGEKIVLDKERCILCGRCVRFTQEVSKTSELGIYNRGDRSVIGTVNDEVMKDNYQVNTVDICPVGALTSKDFRFEQRVWFLKEVSSVCNGCSAGCNVDTHHKSGKHIYRLKPRYNPEVNEYWMCDDGRPTYKTANYDHRLTAAKLGGVELPTNEAVTTWMNDLRTLIATERTDEIAAWIHPDLTSEEITSIVKTLRDEFGISQFYSEDADKSARDDKTVDQLLKRADLWCNTQGFLKVTSALKLKLGSLNQLEERLAQAKINHLVIFGSEKNVGVQSLKRIRAALPADCFTVLISPRLQNAELFSHSLAIPSISHYEKNGTIMNWKKIEQKLGSDFRMFKSAWSVEEILTSLSQEYQRPQKEVSRA